MYYFYFTLFFILHNTLSFETVSPILMNDDFFCSRSTSYTKDDIKIAMWDTNILNYSDLNLGGKTSPTSSSSSISSATVAGDISPILNDMKIVHRNTTTGNISEKKKRIVHPMFKSSYR